MSDWLDDIEDAEGSDDSEEAETSTLFEDNFRRMVNDEDVESLNAQTIKNQIDQINDPELLADAVSVDDREECVEVYRDRVGELNTENDHAPDEYKDQVDDSESDEAEPSDEPDEAEASDETVEEAVEDIEEPDADAAPDGESVEDLLADETDEDDEGAEEASQSPATETDGEDDPVDSDEAEASDDAAESALPDVNVAAIAPGAVSREEAAQREKARTMLVWGSEGTGKSHVAHSAPEPICYLDTEGKADELADKFDGKQIHYWTPNNYEEASDALDEALEVLDRYYEAGHRGTLVVDSMGVMWEWAQVHHMSLTRPSAEGLHEVQFQSSFGQGDGDWQEIKGYHNTAFRDRILESPYHVVLTAGRTEKYDFDGETMDTRWKPDGEKHNKYAVKDVVRLQTDDEGKTVGNLRKAARTRYSFIDLEWPDWDRIYDAIEMLVEAEMADGDVDVTQWDFRVVEGQPVDETPEGSDDDADEGGDD